jgi:hypothetical protein
VSLANVRCPECGNEEAFEVAFRMRRKGKPSHYRYEPEALPNDHILACLQCGGRVGYQQARAAYQENYEQTKDAVLVPVDVDMPISWMKRWRHHEGRMRHGGPSTYTTTGLFVPSVAYALSSPGIGGRSVPTEKVFYVGAVMPDNFYSVSRFSGHAAVIMAWHGKNGKWRSQNDRESYISDTLANVGSDFLNPKIPPERLKRAIERIYEAIADKNADVDNLSVDPIDWSGDETEFRPLGDADMATLQSWIRYGQAKPPEEIVRRFSDGLPKAWYGEGGVDQEWQPILVYNSKRGRLRRLEPVGATRASFGGCPIYYDQDPEVMHLPSQLPTGGKSS